jgi:hypothetical protein
VNYDLILGIWLGVILALLVGAKVVSWLVVKALSLLVSWFERAV